MTWMIILCQKIILQNSVKIAKYKVDSKFRTYTLPQTTFWRIYRRVSSLPPHRPPRRQELGERDTVLWLLLPPYFTSRLLYLWKHNSPYTGHCKIKSNILMFIPLPSKLFHLFCAKARTYVSSILEPQADLKVFCTVSSQDLFLSPLQQLLHFLMIVYFCASPL